MREHKHRVARVDALRESPNFPNGGAPASFVAVVFDVVVDERKVVQQLKRRRGGQSRAPIPPPCFAGPQTQQRANAFARIGLEGIAARVAPAEMIMEHVEKFRVLRMGRAGNVLQFLFERVEIFVYHCGFGRKTWRSGFTQIVRESGQRFCRNGVSRSASSVGAPMPNMATRNCKMSARIPSIVVSVERLASFSKGDARPTSDAPSAMHFAISMPLRMPPLAKIGSAGAARRVCAKLSAVGMPQSQKVSAN